MIRAVVFDAYGTLFDVDAAARQAAAEPGGLALAPVWEALARDWRRKQLEYTWLRALMGIHADFEAVTGDALDWALAAHGVLHDPRLRDRLMALYRRLPVYPETAGVLDRLAGAGLERAILSNGSDGMLAELVDAAGLAARFTALISAAAARTYKPSPAVYDLVGARLGCARHEVLFVSANGWDAAGAAAFGFTAVWVNRAGAPIDRLPGRPRHVCATLDPIPELARAP